MQRNSEIKSSHFSLINILSLIERLRGQSSVVCRTEKKSSRKVKMKLFVILIFIVIVNCQYMNNAHYNFCMSTTNWQLYQFNGCDRIARIK